MVYGLIDQGNHEYYTYLGNVLPALGSAPEAYNWLVTNYYCNMSNAITHQIDRLGYCWLSGQELIRFARQDDSQWIGGVFSGFEKDIPLEQVLAYPLPVWESESFWHTPLTLQHPLATVELVPWDSCCTLLLSKNRQLLDAYRQTYPTAQDLATYQGE